MFSFKSYDYVELTNTVLALRSTLLRFILNISNHYHYRNYIYIHDVDLLSLMIFIYR